MRRTVHDPYEGTINRSNETPSPKPQIAFLNSPSWPLSAVDQQYCGQTGV